MPALREKSTDSPASSTALASDPRTRSVPLYSDHRRIEIAASQSSTGHVSPSNLAPSSPSISISTCLLPGCGKKFGRVYELVRHLTGKAHRAALTNADDATILHAGVPASHLHRAKELLGRTNYCTECKKSFARDDEFKKHLITVKHRSVATSTSTQAVNSTTLPPLDVLSSQFTVPRYAVTSTSVDVANASPVAQHTPNNLSPASTLEPALDDPFWLQQFELLMSSPEPPLDNPLWPQLYIARVLAFSTAAHTPMPSLID
ncbi:hypothetical protein BKA62DRAFT_795752 [Auriculariales sp. MPI-PUGE-AT-0066]|nr:hypothetical protein BKA62DRAFT_795752 [Auriculariales sp. MPI-PUGE-AT-0066]